MGTSEDEFYEMDRGTNYAQVRYLCYYLQEKGLLQRFYREFRAASDADPTGQQTLRKILGIRDMAAFQRAIRFSKQYPNYYSIDTANLNRRRIPG